MVNIITPISLSLVSLAWVLPNSLNNAIKVNIYRPCCLHHRSFRIHEIGMFVLPSGPAGFFSPGRLYHEMIEQIQYAEELGFESVWLAEHHFTRFGMFRQLTSRNLCGRCH
ncbi:MAG: hypothetical protein Ct9H300mP11_21000 [Chloroflexota bacterium]|nr:MAG: hypothetical protein Ct9H300mP11_21000 [Chloroflexota bacterium]